MTVERTFDYALVKQIVTHPKIYPHIVDDHSPKADEWKPIDSDLVWYVMVQNGNGHAVGVFVLAPQNCVCYEFHTCLLPEIWGPLARKAARMMLAWMFANSPCQRIVTNVPEYNRIALRFGRNIGLKEFGVNPKSYLKGGVLYNQILMGISKEDLCH